MPSTRKVLSLKQGFPYVIGLSVNQLAQSVGKKNTHDSNPVPFGVGSGALPLGHHYSYLNLRSSLFINLIMSNLKSKRIIQYAFHSQGFPYAIG